MPDPEQVLYIEQDRAGHEFVGSRLRPASARYRIKHRIQAMSSDGYIMLCPDMVPRGFG
jgi:hypothetical protein